MTINAVNVSNGELFFRNISWDCLVGEETLLANNLLEKDLKIKFPGGAGTVKIADEDQDITSIRIIEGRKCFVVELEDGVQVNGITVS